jgi:hypothetical protein
VPNNTASVVCLGVCKLASLDILICRYKGHASKWISSRRTEIRAY